MSGTSLYASRLRMTILSTRRAFRPLAVSATLLAAAWVPACTGGTDRDPSRRPAPIPEAHQPLVTKVEHFFASGADAERLFHVFRDTFGLTEVWGFQSWGGFASGGVSLGNVAFELVRFTPKNGPAAPTAFAGIAFEPGGDTDAAVAELDRRGIPRDIPDSAVHRTATGRMTGWVNTGLPELDPWSVFFCDYQDRAGVLENRRFASDTLALRHGGALGVLAVREIVLGVTDLEAERRRWRRLIEASAQESDGAFAFGPGPAIRLVPSGAAAIEGLVVQVRSLDRARAFLAERRMLGEADGRRVTIAPSAIGGLHLTLVEQ